MIIQVSTTFDCTHTGITGNFTQHRLPMHDHNGNFIVDDAAWHRARNQQRNYETLVQILSLRTQLVSVSLPERRGDRWVFMVEPERAQVFQDNLRALHDDCQGVPMLINLDESVKSLPKLIVQGPDTNCWFELNI